MFTQAQRARTAAGDGTRLTCASRRRRRAPAARRAHPRSLGADEKVAPVVGAAANERLASISRFAERGAVDSNAWRCLAWRLLAEARAARAAGDGVACRRKLTEVRRLRRRAAKTAAFARMCAGRAERLTRGGGPEE